MKNLLIGFTLAATILSLSSCTTFIAKRINNAENSVDKYPDAVTYKKKLMKTVEVDLNHYQSIQERPYQNKHFAMAMTISGGGYRSANLGLGVMLALEQIRNRAIRGNLLQEVDYISTVSGGGLAAGFYMTQLHNYLLANNTIRNFSLNAATEKMLADDAVAPNPLRADLMTYFFASNPKKGLQVEKILNDTLLNTPSGGLVEGDIFVPKFSHKPVELPFWVINTTIYPNAATFPYTPDVINDYEITGYVHNNQHYYFDHPTIYSPYYMPVSVGVTASLSVPLAMPSTTLESRACDGPCYLQLYDGGISDNLGIRSALNLLAQDHRKIKILLVVDSGRDLNQPFSKFKRPPASMPLIVRLTGFTTDSYRKYVKSHLETIAKNKLCSPNTSNVVAIYLDLAKYPNIQRVKSQLKFSRQDQALLLDTGKELVRENPRLNRFLAQLNAGHVTMGSCHKY